MKRKSYIKQRQYIFVWKSWKEINDDLFLFLLLEKFFNIVLFCFLLHFFLISISQLTKIDWYVIGDGVTMNMYI